MAGPSARGAALLIFLLSVLVLPALGIGVEVSPESIQDMNPFSINITDVTDGTSLGIGLTANFRPTSGTTWLNITGWNYPFALTGGRVSVTGRNVNQMIFMVRAGNTLRTLRGSGAGNVTLEIPLDVQPLVYHDFLIGYEIHDGNAPLTFSLGQQGVKQGMETGALLTPSVIGIREGNLTVLVFANGSLQGSGSLMVLEELPPTPEETGNVTPEPTVSETPSLPPTTQTPLPSETPGTPEPSRPAPQETLTTPPPAETADVTSGPSPWILAYGAAVVIITLVADYLLLRD